MCPLIEVIAESAFHGLFLLPAFSLVLKLELEKLARTDIRSSPARRIWSYPSIFHHLDRACNNTESIHQEDSETEYQQHHRLIRLLHPHLQVVSAELLTMSYYLTLIGTRDNPLYETEITPKTVASSSSAASSSSSYFSSSSSATAVGSSSGNAMSEAGSSGGGMFGGLLSRIPTTSSALTSSSASSASTVGGASVAGSAGRRKQRYELQMIAHSALDTIEDALVTSPYL